MKTKDGAKRSFPLKAMGLALPIAVGGLFFLLAIFTSVPTMIRNGNRQKILAGGTPAKAYNVEIYAGDSPFSGGKFYLVFDYDDADGYRHEGRTAAVYGQTEAMDHAVRGFRVYYTEKGAVEEFFDRSAADKTARTLLWIFLGAGVIAVSAGVALLTRSPGPFALVEKQGVEAEGSVVSAEGDGSGSYSVVVSYVNQRGEAVLGRTERVYTEAEAASFAPGAAIRVKYYGTAVKILPLAAGEDLNG